MTKKNSKNTDNRVNHNTTIDDDLWTMLRFTSISTKIGINDLLEEGIEYLIDKYQEYLPKEYRPKKKLAK
jgi:hypothetical protein